MEWIFNFSENSEYQFDKHVGSTHILHLSTIKG